MQTVLSLRSPEHEYPIARHAALLVPLGSTSPVTSWRTGFISTSVHTAWSISASRSRISLCRCIMYPPRIQIIAWSASNKSPQTHTVGMSLNSQPHLIIITSSNQRLWECVRCRINVYPDTLNDFPSWLSTSKNQPLFINNRGFTERYFSDKVHVSLMIEW